MPSESERKSLPFEPKGRTKSGAKSGEGSPQQGNRQPRKAKKQRQPSRQQASGALADVSEAAKAKAAKIQLKPSRSSKSRPTAPANPKRRNPAQSEEIPKAVSQRMVKRMVIFSGVPTAMAAFIFIGSYIALTRHVWAVPTTLVLLSTLGCFGLGVLGLSYGVLSASWEEDQPGSRWGLAEFRLNFGRMASAWRQQKSGN
ncbi:MAG: PAM68 family protein [Cyanobacteria bacterium P01_A01_bin.105]